MQLRHRILSEKGSQRSMRRLERAVHVIKNNQPKYVVLSEERYRELIDVEGEAYRARVRASLEDVKLGRVRRFKSASDLLKAIEVEDDK